MSEWVSGWMDGWMDTPQTVTTTRAPAVLKIRKVVFDGLPNACISISTLGEHYGNDCCNGGRRAE